jgi:hypothetical protein
MYNNQRPADPNYPTATPSATAYQPISLKNGLYKNCIVEAGEYIVNRDGDIMIATTSNKGCRNHYDKMVNESAIRARYLGNTDDAMECANQMRRATPAEVKRALSYRQQLTLL